MVHRERSVLELEGHSRCTTPPKRQKFLMDTDVDNRLHPQELSFDFHDMHSQQFYLRNIKGERSNKTLRCFPGWGRSRINADLYSCMLRRKSLDSLDSSFSSDSDSDSNDSENENREIQSQIAHKNNDDIVSPSSVLDSVGLSHLGKLHLASTNFEFRDNLSNQAFQLHSSGDKILDSEKIILGSCTEEKKLLTARVDKCGNTELHLKIHNKDETGVLEIIQKATGFDDLNMSNKFGQTPMHLAVMTGQGKILRKLICAGGLVSEVDNDGNTPLHLASSRGCLSLVRHLLKPIQYDETIGNQYSIPVQAIPQDLAAKNEDGFSCIELATSNGHFDVVKELEEI